MKVKVDENIKIKQILMSNGVIKFVEYWSDASSRNHIISADRFCDVFGYTVEELEQEKK